MVGGDSSTESTQLLCGHFSFRNMADHPILNALPDYIVITAEMRQHEPWLDELLRIVAQRSFSDGLGSAASVTRLSEIVFIEILRAGIGQSESLAALLEGFRDRQIGRAMELIHRSPEQPWSVETLAAEVGMSRSRFAERFRQLVGTSPAAYLSDWRLQKALSLLDGPRCQIKQVASQTGYQSAAAFSRAFAGRFGCAPTEYRRDFA